MNNSTSRYQVLQPVWLRCRNELCSGFLNFQFTQLCMKVEVYLFASFEFSRSRSLSSILPVLIPETENSPVQFLTLCLPTMPLLSCCLLESYWTTWRSPNICNSSSLVPLIEERTPGARRWCSWALTWTDGLHCQELVIWKCLVARFFQAPSVR